MCYTGGMESNKFNFCPECGSKAIETKMGGRKWLCPECGFDLYNNVASAVGLVIENDKGEVLFERRAKEPRKGFLALPGGFTEPDESGEGAALRECKEEIGVEPLSVSYICSYPNTYAYKGITYKTCDMFFSAKLPPQAELKAQQGEVSEFLWLKLESTEDVEKCPIAFDSAKKTMLTWLAQK